LCQLDITPHSHMVDPWPSHPLPAPPHTLLLLLGWLWDSIVELLPHCPVACYTDIPLQDYTPATHLCHRTLHATHRAFCYGCLRGCAWRTHTTHLPLPHLRLDAFWDVYYVAAALTTAHYCDRTHRTHTSALPVYTSITPSGSAVPPRYPDSLPTLRA